MLSQRCRYALKALINLARAGGAPRGVSLIAAEENIPRKFLEAIMSDLRRSGLVESTRGKSGGYKLICSPGRLTIGQIIRAVDGPIAPTRCVSASAYAKCDDCPDEMMCAIRPLMQEVREAISRAVDLKTLEALARETDGRSLARVQAGDFAI